MCNLKMDPFVLDDLIQMQHLQIGLTRKFFVVPFTLTNQVHICKPILIFVKWFMSYS